MYLPHTLLPQQDGGHEGRSGSGAGQQNGEQGNVDRIAGVDVGQLGTAAGAGAVLVVVAQSRGLPGLPWPRRRSRSGFPCRSPCRWRPLWRSIRRTCGRWRESPGRRPASCRRRRRGCHRRCRFRCRWAALTGPMTVSLWKQAVSVSVLSTWASFASL